MEHKKTFAQIIILIVLVILGIIAISVFKEKLPQTPSVTIPDEPVACTMEARMCPDGSYVGRQGPKCEFAACPAPVSATTSSTTVVVIGTTTPVVTKTLTVGIGEKAQVGAFGITPVQVLEDSRCPVNVQCIQAGTVRLRAQIVSTIEGTRTADFTLGTPISFDSNSITAKLSEVSPVTVAGNKIATSSYKFTFIIQ